MSDLKKRRRLEKEEALLAMQRYCAYQDRCHSQVRTRLLEHQVYGHDLEEIIAELIVDDFLNEERYARSYVRGKFNINRWGKRKILLHLKQQHISDYCIRKGMSEILDDEYRKAASELIAKKISQLKETEYHVLRRKITSYMTQKGYEYEVISEVLSDIIEK